MHFILNKRADTHHDFCEDSFHYTERDGWVICGVFDGCSDGINSHFASQLHAYSFRNILSKYWSEHLQLMDANRIIPVNLINGLGILLATNVLAMTQAMSVHELENLSTAVLALYNVRSKHLVVKFIGDGAVCVDGVMHRVDSGPANTPSYLGYLDVDETDQIEDEDIYPVKIFTDVKSFSLCTDGIDYIRHPHKSVEECIHFLLQDTTLLPSAKMLPRKCNILTKEGAQFNDDITIIRYINETL